MKDRPSNKPRIIICIVVLLIIYFLFGFLALKYSSNISNVNDTQGLIMIFPAQYILFLTLAMGVTLMYLRSLLANKIMRIWLIYLALVNFLAAIYSLIIVSRFLLFF